MPFSFLPVMAQDLLSTAAMAFDTRNDVSTHGESLWPAERDAQLQPESNELDGKFSNCFLVGFNAYVFIFDFGMVTTEGGNHTHSRVVASIADAQQFSDLLAVSVAEHAKQYGRTREPQ